MGIDKFGRSSVKKMQGPIGPTWLSGECGELGTQGPPGEKGETGLRGIAGEGFIKAQDVDYDLNGKIILNIGMFIEDDAVWT